VNIKEFLVTIVSEAKRPQTQYLSLKGEFWVCSEANSRMVKNSFQRAEGYLGNSPSNAEVSTLPIHFRRDVMVKTVRKG
jgi:hypothetical protein